MPAIQTVKHGPGPSIIFSITYCIFGLFTNIIVLAVNLLLHLGLLTSVSQAVNFAFGFIWKGNMFTPCLAYVLDRFVWFTINLAYNNYWLLIFFVGLDSVLYHINVATKILDIIVSRKKDKTVKPLITPSSSFSSISRIGSISTSTPPLSRSSRESTVDSLNILTPHERTSNPWADDSITLSPSKEVTFHSLRDSPPDSSDDIIHFSPRLTSANQRQPIRSPLKPLVVPSSGTISDQSSGKGNGNRNGLTKLQPAAVIRKSTGRRGSRRTFETLSPVQEAPSENLETPTFSNDNSTPSAPVSPRSSSVVHDSPEAVTRSVNANVPSRPRRSVTFNDMTSIRYYKRGANQYQLMFGKEDPRLSKKRITTNKQHIQGIKRQKASHDFGWNYFEQEQQSTETPIDVNTPKPIVCRFIPGGPNAVVLRFDPPYNILGDLQLPSGDIRLAKSIINDIEDPNLREAASSGYSKFRMGMFGPVLTEGVVLPNSWDGKVTLNQEIGYAGAYGKYFKEISTIDPIAAPGKIGIEEEKSNELTSPQRQDTDSTVCSNSTTLVGTPTSSPSLSSGSTVVEDSPLTSDIASEDPSTPKTATPSSYKPTRPYIRIKDNFFQLLSFFGPLEDNDHWNRFKWGHLSEEERTARKAQYEERQRQKYLAEVKRMEAAHEESLESHGERLILPKKYGILGGFSRWKLDENRIKLRQRFEKLGLPPKKSSKKVDDNEITGMKKHINKAAKHVGAAREPFVAGTSGDN